MRLGFCSTSLGCFGVLSMGPDRVCICCVLKCQLHIALFSSRHPCTTMLDIGQTWMGVRLFCCCFVAPGLLALGRLGCSRRVFIHLLTLSPTRAAAPSLHEGHDAEIECMHPRSVASSAGVRAIAGGMHRRSPSTRRLRRSPRTCALCSCLHAAAACA